MDALSIPAYVAKLTGWRAPGAVALAGAAGAIGIAWSRLRRGPELGMWLLAAAIVYMGFFLFAKQAFCNYYYFVGVLILGAAATLEPKPS
jgi:hypothetical protein